MVATKERKRNKRPEGPGLSDLGDVYRESLRQKLETLRTKDRQGVLARPLSNKDAGTIDAYLNCGPAVERSVIQDAMELVQRYDHWLEAYLREEADRQPPRPPQMSDRKFVLATRASCGADAYVWTIQTDDGQWMSEPGFAFPSHTREFGLRSKEASITPHSADRHASQAEAIAAAARRGVAWLEHQAMFVEDEAAELVETVKIAVMAWLEQAEQAEPAGKQPAAAADVFPETSAASGDTGRADARRSPGETGLLWVPVEALQTLAANPEPAAEDVARIVAGFQDRGQDEPIIVLPAHACPGEVLLPPGKRWLVLAGATRLAAAVQLGWTTLQARERPGMSWGEVLAFAYRNNHDRRAIGTAERAGYAAAIAAATDGDMNVEQLVAERMGLDRSEVNQLLRWSQLPAAWQERVRRYESDREDPDGLPWSCAKAFLPYLHVKPIVQELERTWKQDGWARGSLRSKGDVRDQVRRIAERTTPPIFADGIHT